jgi:hypothetical protein
MANAVSDLALLSSGQVIPAEFWPDHESRFLENDLHRPWWERKSGDVVQEGNENEFTTTPLDCLLAKQNGHTEKPAEVEEGCCTLPSRYFMDNLGVYAISFPLKAPSVVRENTRAYVSPETPDVIIRDDCRENLPKLQSIRLMDKCSFYEGHGKRGRKPFYLKQDRTTVRKPLPAV